MPSTSFGDTSYPIPSYASAFETLRPGCTWHLNDDQMAVGEWNPGTPGEEDILKNVTRVGVGTTWSTMPTWTEIEAEVAREKDRRLHEEEKREAMEAKLQDYNNQQNGMVGMMTRVMERLIPDPNAQQSNDALTREDLYEFAEMMQPHRDDEALSLARGGQQQDNQMLIAMMTMMSTMMQTMMQQGNQAAQRNMEFMMSMMQNQNRPQNPMFDDPLMKMMWSRMMERAFDTGTQQQTKNPTEVLREAFGFLNEARALLPGGQQEQAGGDEHVDDGVGG